MRRALIVAASIGALGTCSAAAYSLAPSSPASCWVGKDARHHDVVNHRLSGNWQLQACIFERVTPDGRVLEQTGLVSLGFGIPAPTQPMRPVKVRPIFGYHADN